MNKKNSRVGIVQRVEMNSLQKKKLFYKNKKFVISFIIILL
jgi:hypothetical protein